MRDCTASMFKLEEVWQLLIRNMLGFSALLGCITEFQVKKYQETHLDCFGNHQYLDEKFRKVHSRAEIQKYQLPCHKS